jgi:hypothetical protein
MIPAWLVVVVVAEILARLLMPPRSFAAAAEQEALRRQLAGPSIGSYNNDTLSLERERAVAADAALLPDARADGSSAGSRDEAWWRARVAAIREAILNGEQRVTALESEIARLDTEAIARDDPAQQATLRQQAIETRGELDRVRAGVAATHGELADVLEEARRLNVPPGWLR